MTPLMDRPRRRAGLLRRASARCSSASIGLAGRQAGAGEDAALRQQERVPGDARPARGRHARDVERRWRRTVAAYLRDGARGGEHRDLRRHRGAVQLQRPGAPLLHAPRRERGRRAGEPPAQGRPARGRATPSPWRSARRSIRSRAATAPAPRSPRSRRGRRCSRRWWPRSTPRTTARGSAAAHAVKAGVRAHAGRGGRGLDGGGAAAASGSSASTACGPRRRGERGADRPDAHDGALGRPTRGWPACRRRARAVAIVPRLGLADRRRRVEALLAVPVATARGPAAAGAVRHRRFDHARAPLRMRKNLRPVIYVTGDVAGTIESPVYAILAMNRKLDTIRVRRRARSRATTRCSPTGSTRPPSSGTASGR